MPVGRFRLRQLGRIETPGSLVQVFGRRSAAPRRSQAAHHPGHDGRIPGRLGRGAVAAGAAGGAAPGGHDSSAPVGGGRVIQGDPGAAEGAPGELERTPLAVPGGAQHDQDREADRHPVAGRDVEQPGRAEDRGHDPDPEQPGDDAVVCAVANRDTTRAEFSTTAYNGGLLPVRVTEVGLRGEIQGVVTVDEVLMGPENNQRGDVDADLVPFEPFRLRPGDERLVWVRATLPSCEEARRDRVLLFRDVPLRASVLGLPRNSSAPLDPPVRMIVERC